MILGVDISTDWPVLAGIAVVSCQWGSVMIRLKSVEFRLGKMENKS